MQIKKNGSHKTKLLEEKSEQNKAKTYRTKKK